MSLKRQSFTKLRRRASRNAPRNRFSHELRQLHFPQNLKRVFFRIPENVVASANKFTAEMCCSLCSEILDAVRWGPNNVVKNEELVWDWRRRCISFPDFKIASVPALHGFSIFVTPLLYMFKAIEASRLM